MNVAISLLLIAMMPRYFSIARGNPFKFPMCALWSGNTPPPYINVSAVHVMTQRNNLQHKLPSIFIGNCTAKLTAGLRQIFCCVSDGVLLLLIVSHRR